jgi:hypothetical protein
MEQRGSRSGSLKNQREWRKAGIVDTDAAAAASSSKQQPSLAVSAARQVTRSSAQDIMDMYAQRHNNRKLVVMLVGKLGEGPVGPRVLTGS